jgi:hypothetical protein
MGTEPARDPAGEPHVQDREQREERGGDAGVFDPRQVLHAGGNQAHDPEHRVIAGVEPCQHLEVPASGDLAHGGPPVQAPVLVAPVQLPAQLDQREAQQKRGRQH